MKKLIALALALSMLAALSACTEKQEGATTTQEAPLRGQNGQLLNPPEDTVPEEGPAAKGTGPAVSATKPVTVGEEVRGVTFSEGRTIAWMADALDKLGVCDEEALLKAAKTMDLSLYPVAAGAGKKKHCSFKIEGYAYPATYDFRRNMKAEEVWKIMLGTTESRITSADRARAAALGYSVNDILTIASILQKEVKEKDMKVAASVIYNRLKKKMKLQMDSTIRYVDGALVGFTTVTDATKAAYNTYKCAALPAGPICNPGRAAIDAALYPASSSYTYFCTSADETKILFADNLQQHYKNCDALGIGHKEGT